MDNTENISSEGYIMDTDKNPILLRLPSEFCDGDRPNSELTQLRKMELELRIGEAFDALKSLRRFLGLKSFLTRQKYNHKAPKGLAVTLRSEEHSTRAQKQIESCKATYRRNWARLQDLSKDFPGDFATNLKRLRELTDADCRTLAEWTDEDRQRKLIGEVRTAQMEEKGGHSTQLPWIWRLEFENYDESHPEIEQWNQEGQ